MIDRLMPYFDKATNLVPKFGQGEAVVFTGALLAESLVRFNPANDLGVTIFFLDVIKHIQFYASFAKTSYGRSWVNVLKAHCSLLPSNYIGLVLIKAITKTQDVDILTDRPPLVSIVASYGEAAKMGAKIVGCLATGKVIGDMVDAQISGKVRFAVSVALLALSALNIKSPVIEN